MAGSHAEVVPIQSAAMRQSTGGQGQDAASHSPDNDQPYSPNDDLTSHRPSPSSQGRNPRSCHTCRRRKVRCDKREGGCGNCAKAHIECFYPGPGRAPRRPKSGVPKGATQRETELLKRLRRLEGVVEELSGQVETEHGSRQLKGGEGDNANASNSSPIRVVGMDEGMASTKTWANRMLDINGGPPLPQRIENEFGKLVIDEGKSAYVSNAFWARFHGEIQNIREIFEEDDHASEDDDDILSSPGGSGSLSAATVNTSNHQSFVMGYSSADVDLRKLHPLPSQIPFYWETYKENVDPLCKILHIPTMAKTMKEIQANLGSLSPSTALCFAIYFAAIVSMETEEVHMNFGLDKSYMLKQYRFATEQALAKASFLTTSEIVTVQALVIFLVCVRRFDDSKFVWTLTGLAIRIAQSIGLHRDGTNFNLCPFDTEMRRRCWWQLCILDVRAAEDYGSDPAILEFSFDTQLPLNINDADLDPQSLESPVPREGVSEMTFCMIRFEICHTSRQLSYIPPKDGPCKYAAEQRTLAEKEEILKQLHETLESKYLRPCKDAGPLYWVAATVSRLIVAKMGLVIYLPHLHEGLTQVIKDRLFVSSIQIMEYSQLLQTEVSTRKWGWLFHTYIQWHAIAYILGEVCARPRSAIVDRGWRAVDAVFNDWDDLVRHSKEGMHWMPMRRLMAKARRKREADMLSSGETLFTQPSQLRDSDSPDTLPPNPPTYGSYPVASPSLFDDADLPNGLDPVLKPAVEHTLANYLPPTTIPPQTQSQAQGLEQPHPTVHLSQQPYSSQPYQSTQAAQLPTHLSTNRPWILDDSALVDLDMSFLDGDENAGTGTDGDMSNANNWDELVSYFQMETDAGNPSGDPRLNGPNGAGGFNVWH